MNAARHLLCAALVAVVALPSEADVYEGLSGRELLEAIAADCRPSRYLAPDGIFDVLAEADAMPDGGVLNRWDDGALPANLKDDAMYVNILPATWWRETAPGYDLHNIVPCPADVPALKGDVAPGQVVKPYYSNAHWAVGTGMIGDVATGCYTPPVGFEGDFARAALYVVTLYGGLQPVAGDAFNFMDSNAQPPLRPHAVRQLLAWADADPPDSRELRRDAVIALRQGNHNPYVVHPTLVRRVLEPASPDTPSDPVVPGDGDDTPTPAERVPLRAVYTLSDSRIDLWSPYIPEDVTWQIDGVGVEREYLVPADLGVGRHTLSFANEELSGSLIIEIKP